MLAKILKTQLFSHRAHRDHRDSELTAINLYSGDKGGG